MNELKSANTGPVSQTQFAWDQGQTEFWNFLSLRNIFV